MYQESQNFSSLCLYFISELEAQELPVQQRYGALILALRTMSKEAESRHLSVSEQIPSLIGNVYEYHVADECQKQNLLLKSLLLTGFAKLHFDTFLLASLSPFSLVRAIARGYYMSLDSSAQALKDKVGLVIDAIEAITESDHVNQHIQTEVLPSLHRELGENSELEQLILRKLEIPHNQLAPAQVSLSR